MKKKLIEILSVVPTFQLLTNKHFNDFSISFKIAKAYKELESNRDFYLAEEKKLVDSYARKDEKGNVIIEDGNRVTFENAEIREKFQTEILKLQTTEIEIFDPFELCITDFRSGDGLTPKEILSLDGFINFVESKEEARMA